MPESSHDNEMRHRVQRIESLLQEIDSAADRATGAKVREVVQNLMEFHGAGLERILEQLAAQGESGRQTIDCLADDPLVEGLLLLYGLHPLDMESRVRQALDKVRPLLMAHGGNVELLGVADGVVRLRMEGSCHGCPSSAATLKNSIEQAIDEKAPDVQGIEVEGMTGATEELLDIAAPSGPSNGHANGHRFALPVLRG